MIHSLRGLHLSVYIVTTTVSGKDGYHPNCQSYSGNILITSVVIRRISRTISDNNPYRYVIFHLAAGKDMLSVIFLHPMLARRCVLNLQCP